MRRAINDDLLVLCMGLMGGPQLGTTIEQMIQYNHKMTPAWILIAKSIHTSHIQLQILTPVLYLLASYLSQYLLSKVSQSERVSPIAQGFPQHVDRTQQCLNRETFSGASITLTLAGLSKQSFISPLSMLFHTLKPLHVGHSASAAIDRRRQCRLNSLNV